MKGNKKAIIQIKVQEGKVHKQYFFFEPEKLNLRKFILKIFQLLQNCKDLITHVYLFLGPPIVNI